MVTMTTRSEFMSAICALPEGGRALQNNEVIALLLLQGMEFPKIGSVEELASLPIGSLVLDKDFKVIEAKHASADRPDNDEQVFAERSPLYFLCSPD